MATDWHPTQAIGPDGERVDVKDVQNGLKCGCVCFDCGQLVVAKQGPKLRWHFAHHVSTSCRPSPESELHFFAKTLLADRLWLWIPPVRANAADMVKRISEGGKYRFAEVRVERADGNVRPDLLLIAKGGETLHIEIFVRSKVDSVKLEKLRTRGISSIEIDLSRLDWDVRDSWERAILETAPRKWLHNAIAAKAEREMAATADQDAERKAAAIEAEFEKISNTWNAARLSYAAPDQRLASERTLALKRGFHSVIGHPGMGERCFVVSPEYWQARLANRFLWDELATSPKSFETRQALAYIQELVRPGLGRISADVAVRMKERSPDFLTPWHTVHNYLKWLKEQHWMFDRRVVGKQWLASGDAIDRRKVKEADWKRELERKAEMEDWLDYLLSNIPEGEHQAFDRSKWIDWFVASYDEESAMALLEDVCRMVVSGEVLADDLIGLPLDREYERQVDSQNQRRAEEKKRRALELEQSRKDARTKSIRTNAVQAFGNAAADWLETLNEKLGAITPLAWAEISDDNLETAIDVLQKEWADRRETAAQEAAASKRQSTLDANRIDLEAIARKRTRDPDRAVLWLRSPNPKLGGKRPFDFCVDEPSLKVCRTVMPAKI